MPAKRDINLLNCIYSNAADGKWLVSTQNFYSKCGMDDEEQIRQALLKLGSDGYIEVLFTDRHGEPFMYITLTNKARDFLSAKNRRRRELFSRLALAVFSAVVTYCFGKILYALFT